MIYKSFPNCFQFFYISNHYDSIDLRQDLKDKQSLQVVCCFNINFSVLSMYLKDSSSKGFCEKSLFS